MKNNKVYILDDKEYKLKGNTLEVLNATVPLLAELRSKEYEYTKHLELDELRMFEKEMNELSIAKSQIEKILETRIDEEGNPIDELQVTQKKNHLNDIEEKISAKNEYFKQNLKKIADIEQEMKAYALLDLISSRAVIEKSFNKILEGSKPINFESENILNFCREVITDFFSIIFTARQL
jgi:Glu-tRNA(Gln) amidotransferase subunit E-like FAD-binding protein